MANLGELGQIKPDVEVDVFSYFGEEIRVNPAVSEITLMDFLEAGSVLLTAKDKGQEQMLLLKGLLRDTVHPEDFDRFWSLARANRQGVEDISEVAVKVIEAVTERPTVRPSDSSDGSTSTGTSSPDDSYSRAMRRYDGRPDLQLALVRAQDQRESQAG